MTIEIEEYRFKTIIGILDFERTTPQDVTLYLRIEYTYKDTFINYAEVAALLKKRMIEQKFLLIEDALRDLSQNLKKTFSQIEELRLKITKPSILPDCTVSVSENYLFNS